jgi:hypothetical protein
MMGIEITTAKDSGRAQGLAPLRGAQWGARNFLKLSAIGVLLCFALLLPSCGNGPSPTVSSAPPTVQSSAIAQPKRIEIKGDQGTVLFALKPMEDGAKLLDPSNGELVRLKMDDRFKLKIKEGGDRVTGYVVAEAGGTIWKLKDANQAKVLYTLHRQPDGDYKLEDGSDRLLYRIKKRGDGFEIENPTKQSLYKVKVKGDKTSLRDAKDKTKFSTKSMLAPITMACFGLDGLTQAQQAALAYAVNQTGGR